MPVSRRILKALLAAALLLGLAFLPGCVLLFKEGEYEPVDPEEPPMEIASPIKVHLTDGTVALFRSGGTFAGDTLRGTGVRYSLTLQDSTAIRRVPLDSVMAVETYQESVRTGPSLLASTLGTAAVAAITPVLAVAIFGSCPTVYSSGDSLVATGDSLVLEAESFSNSIAPLLELRDVDVLRADADATGELTLEIRNEALETHYINHLELVEVRHAHGEQALPTEDGGAWIVGDVRAPSRLTDRTGRDVSTRLATADGRAYRTPQSALEALDAPPATASDPLSDHIDIVLPSPTVDTVLVLLRLRNSLLNTVLFYEYMLAGQGPWALDWLGMDMSVISSVIELSDFYARRMGLRVQVETETGFETVGRVREVGPIAWSLESVAVPVPAGHDSLRLRLSFVADAWRIDHLTIAHQVQRGAPVLHPIDTVRLQPRPATASLLPPRAAAAHERLRQPDHTYWITGPTDRFWATFAPGALSPGTARTFFLAAQGYYTEWMRRDWLRTPDPTPTLTLNDAVLRDALRTWRDTRPAWEARFESSKLPVR